MSRTIRHVLLDIEGTTCPVSFVSTVLFPYAQEQLQTFLEQHKAEAQLLALTAHLQRSWEGETDPEARELLLQASGEQARGAGSTELSPPALLPYLQWLNRQNRKLTAWKDLQGMIWLEGYRNGALKAELFEDVAPVLRDWHQQGITLSVYSSGSVAAQRLLYGHTEDGDLTSLFSHWFDTRIGLKQATESYQHILNVLDCPGDAVLFISDGMAELEAASICGIRCLYSVRPGNAVEASTRFQPVNDFRSIDLDALG